jgi:hypothetical protein
MRRDLTALDLLSAMITPAVLISACGTLIVSTSSRLARIVDRARGLSRLLASCIRPLAEVRLAVVAVRREMDFALRLRDPHDAKRAGAPR